MGKCCVILKEKSRVKTPLSVLTTAYMRKIKYRSCGNLAGEVDGRNHFIKAFLASKIQEAAKS